MNNKIRVLLVIAALFAAQLACNNPIRGSGQDTQISSPNMTLTALFAVTPRGTATATLPPVITNTPASANTDTVQPAVNSTPTVIVQTLPTATASVVSSPTPMVQVLPTATAVVPAAIPGTRPRAAVVAKYLSTPPTIDGDWSEWKDLTTEYPANNVVWGRDKWTGEDDLSSSFHIGWDNSYLYIAVKVRDNKYVQNAPGADLYKGDSIEVLMDTKLQDDYYYNQLSPDDFQLGISPGRPDPSGTKEAYLWFPDNIAGGRSGVKIASRLESGMYRLEAAIPWNIFEMTPANGMHYGFALSVSDNDDPTQNVQQKMVSNDPNRRLADPTTWGDLQLVK